MREFIHLYGTSVLVLSDCHDRLFTRLSDLKIFTALARALASASVNKKK
jgi:hypothetical protein